MEVSESVKESCYISYQVNKRKKKYKANIVKAHSLPFMQNFFYVYALESSKHFLHRKWEYI